MRKINKPDITNPDPRYWERVLESHGLGTRHLKLEEDPEENEETIPTHISLSEMIEAEEK